MSETRDSNPWFGVSMALVGIIVGYGLAIGANGLSGGDPSATARIAAPAAAPVPSPDAPPEPPPPPTYDKIVAVDPSEDHIQGKENAVISIIEYTDFQCPFCQRHHPTMQQIVADYDGKVNWVFRHFPLAFHGNAQKAAEASECAAAQGGNDAFWSFADGIFEKGTDPPILKQIAADLSLDTSAFDGCLEDGTFADEIQKEMQGGSTAGVNGTPGTGALLPD